MNKIKKLITDANLNIKREFSFLLIANLLIIVGAILAFIKSTNILYVFCFLLVILIFNFAMYYRYKYLKRKNDYKNLDELINLFRIVFQNLNIDFTFNDALASFKPTASYKMNEIISKLQSQTTKSITLLPYLEFAHEFNSIKTEEMMIAIYRYNKDSSPENLKEFNSIYNEFINQSKLEVVKNKTNQYDLIKITPVIGAMLAVLIVIVSVILVVGSYIHG